ncbi:MAG: carboxypeptidase regulatory-like domain-containing protein [Acidobacteria bacterium]|nr:carboxypeptidase regulatory-like domain-containing protein [Acidobacteriota bacterium]
MTLFAAATQGSELRGRITDPSSSPISGARVAIAGPVKRNTRSNDKGEYAFTDLPPGRYSLAATAPQLSLPAPVLFTLESTPLTLNIELKVSVVTQSVNVEETAANAVAADTRNNPAALILRGEDLDMLADKPEDLLSDLMALAGPSAGPNGGAIFIDGFSGGQLPSKDAIREIRINQNPFGPENDRVGFGTIEVFTKPGSEKFKGAVYYNFADAILNTRNPYAAQKAPFNLHEFGGNFGGPLSKKSSFFVDVRRDDIDNGAVISGAILNPATQEIINPYTNVLLIPQKRLSVSPRADWQVSPNFTLTARYTYNEASVTNSGVGSFNLPERGVLAKSTANTAQLTGTWIAGPNTVNETRAQFFRLASSNLPNNTTPAIQVLGAFSGGGSLLGNSADTRNSFELQNYTSMSRGKHTVRFGIRLRGESADTRVFNNFNGTFTFGGPNSLEQYRRATPTQFTLNAGQPNLSANQIDAGLFIGDDWRLRPNLTLGYGLRYETQTNLGDPTNFAPRIALALAPKPKSVLRAATGIFYDRFGLNNTLNATRYNGILQQQYVIANPNFYPSTCRSQSPPNHPAPQQRSQRLPNLANRDRLRPPTPPRHHTFSHLRWRPWRSSPPLQSPHRPHLPGRILRHLPPAPVDHQRQLAYLKQALHLRLARLESRPGQHRRHRHLPGQPIHRQRRIRPCCNRHPPARQPRRHHRLLARHPLEPPSHSRIRHSLRHYSR